ncbi:VIP36-like protein [Candida viswanathii]|uniref:VIP36-like protein n=1 Tax=Candida viswanathii TaxID=5486 RepID=A0A367YN08_9ASCO|nr:VIP36-like protein [Candida viswanathii]
MAITIHTVKRSRPLQLLLALVGLITLYALFFTEWVFSSSATYTPEEINTLLQNKESHIVSLNKKELIEQTITKPYLDESRFHVRNWDLHGNTLVRNNEFIRLTANSPHQASNMFSKWPIHADSFEMELTFHIHNDQAKHGLVGDGLAIWILDKPSDIGDVFGIQNKFKGLGIMLDTFKNGKRGQFPYVNIMLGDGKTYYNKATDGYETRLAGCIAKQLLNPDAKETKMRLVYIKNGYLSIDFNYYGRHEEWQNCVSLTDVQLPETKYLGLSAETGQLVENVDIIENRIYALYKPDNTFVESIGELQELIHDQNEYESEVSSVAEAIREEEEAKVRKTGGRHRQFRKKLSGKRRKSLKRLEKAEKRIKERERQMRLEKYGSEDVGFLGYWFGKFLVVLKYMIYILILVVLVWFALIIIRIQNQKRKQKTTGLLD